MTREEIVAQTIVDIRLYTGTPDAALAQTINMALDAIDAGIPGDFVECGVWMGGCSFAMLRAQQHTYGTVQRPVWMYDSFEGMSPPIEKDGTNAAHWWEMAKGLPKNEASNEYCICPVERVEEAITQLDLWGNVKLVPGWLHETLPLTKPDKIALLRVDCDWYEPVSCVLDELVPRVSPGGGIIIDDYHAWEGARLATHDYLTEHSLAWPISPIGDRNGAWMVKA